MTEVKSPNQQVPTPPEAGRMYFLVLRCYKLNLAKTKSSLFLVGRTQSWARFPGKGLPTGQHHTSHIFCTAGKDLQSSEYNWRFRGLLPTLE